MATIPGPADPYAPERYCRLHPLGCPADGRGAPHPPVAERVTSLAADPYRDAEPTPQRDPYADPAGWAADLAAVRKRHR